MAGFNSFGWFYGVFDGRPSRGFDGLRKFNAFQNVFREMSKAPLRIRAFGEAL